MLGCLQSYCVALQYRPAVNACPWRVEVIAGGSGRRAAGLVSASKMRDHSRRQMRTWLPGLCISASDHTITTTAARGRRVAYLSPDMPVLRVGDSGVFLVAADAVCSPPAFSSGFHGAPLAREGVHPGLCRHQNCGLRASPCQCHYGEEGECGKRLIWCVNRSILSLSS